MAKKIKLELTLQQFEATLSLVDTISGMIGVGSDFDTHEKDIKLFDKMLNKNGYKRQFN
jgi:hypothetical protein